MSTVFLLNKKVQNMVNAARFPKDKTTCTSRESPLPASFTLS